MYTSSITLISSSKILFIIIWYVELTFFKLKGIDVVLIIGTLYHEIIFVSICFMRRILVLSRISIQEWY